jgi:hypothetical protein
MTVEARSRASLRLGAVGMVLVVAGLVGVLLCGGSAWRAWLAAAFLAASAPVGALGLLMTVHLIPGGWRHRLRGFLAAQVRLLPAGLLAGLPVLFVLSALYPWTHQDQATGFRAAYLSPPGFVARTLVWWGVLAGSAFLLGRVPGRRRTVCAIGLLLYLPLGSMAAVDWLMSLDPAFTSSGFGLYVICIQMLLALSLGIAAATGLVEPPDNPGVLGAVLLTFLMVWAYLAFMQYVIVWSGDLPAGAAWYLRRARGGWDLVFWAVCASRLAPLILLLFGPVRRNARRLLWLSIAVILGTVLEIAWLAFPADNVRTSATDLVLYGVIVAGVAAFGVGAYRPALAAVDGRDGEPGAAS